MTAPDDPLDYVRGLVRHAEGLEVAADVDMLRRLLAFVSDVQEENFALRDNNQAVKMLFDERAKLAAPDDPRAARLQTKKEHDEEFTRVDREWS